MTAVRGEWCTQRLLTATLTSLSSSSADMAGAVQRLVCGSSALRDERASLAVLRLAD